MVATNGWVKASLPKPRENYLSLLGNKQSEAVIIPTEQRELEWRIQAT
jgi:hypothetical protein